MTDRLLRESAVVDALERAYLGGTTSGIELISRNDAIATVRALASASPEPSAPPRDNRIGDALLILDTAETDYNSVYDLARDLTDILRGTYDEFIVRPEPPAPVVTREVIDRAFAAVRREYGYEDTASQIFVDRLGDAILSALSDGPHQ